MRRARSWDRRAAERARIIPACADGMSNAAAARHVDVQAKTVSKWRRKFAVERLAGLQDAGRIGRPKADLVLSGAERGQLMRWARRAAKTAQYLALRARIVVTPTFSLRVLRCLMPLLGGCRRSGRCCLGNVLPRSRAM
nr:helix-turn-helix domain-containing protein [Kitasatospora sp. GP82]